MKGTKTVYICSECEYTSAKWLGKCPKCSAWNSFVEDVIATEPQTTQKKRTSLSGVGENHVQEFKNLEMLSKLPECLIFIN